eukprot:scaffold19787_cov27-Phaeocystis_antarctica.AAC.1
MAASTLALLHPYHAIPCYPAQGAGWAHEAGVSTSSPQVARMHSGIVLTLTPTPIPTPTPNQVARMD